MYIIVSNNASFLLFGRISPFELLSLFDFRRISNALFIIYNFKYPANITIKLTSKSEFVKIIRFIYEKIIIVL